MKVVEYKYSSIWPMILFLLVGTPSIGQHQRQEGAKTSVLRTKIERYLLSVDSTFSYSALVFVDGKLIVQGGYGWTDNSKTFRTTERTLFNVASITKSFTATSIFQLREKGTLRLQDTLARFFQGVPPDKQSVTLMHLLTHTSGLGQNYVSDGVVDRDSAVRLILEDSLRFVPGRGFSYSNENYELLGAIIEVVTGKTYEDYVRENIFRRSNMTDTRFWAEALKFRKNEIAGKYEFIAPGNLGRNWGYIGSGGIFTTVGDLYRWFNALARGTLLARSSLELMWKTHWQLSETGVTPGWYRSTTNGAQEIWTRGTESWGHNGVVRWFAAREVLVIVLSNSGELGDRSTTANRLISDEIVKIIFK